MHQLLWPKQYSLLLYRHVRSMAGPGTLASGDGNDSTDSQEVLGVANVHVDVVVLWNDTYIHIWSFFWMKLSNKCVLSFERFFTGCRFLQCARLWHTAHSSGHPTTCTGWTHWRPPSLHVYHGLLCVCVSSTHLHQLETRITWRNIFSPSCS